MRVAPGRRSAEVVPARARSHGPRSRLVAGLRSRGLWAAILYVALTLAWLWPLPASFGSALAPDLGDPLLNSWILAWNFHQLEGGAGSYWDANIFWPTSATLTFSETLLPLALVVYPIWALTRDAVVAYNVALVLGFAMTGWATFLLARWYLTRGARRPTPAGGEPHRSGSTVVGTGAALVAGLAAAFSPYRADQFVHLQVMWVGWLPLAAYCGERYLARPNAAWIWATGASAVALALTNTYFAVFGGTVLAVYLGLRVAPALVAGPWVPAAHLAHAIVVALLATAALLAVGLRYRDAQQQYEIERPPEVVHEFSGRPADLLRASDGLRFWGPRIGRREDFQERHLFPGLTTALLALVGLMAGRRKRPMARSSGEEPVGARHRWLRRAFATMTVLALGAVVILLAGVEVRWQIGNLPVQMTDLNRPLVLAAVGIAGWLATSPRARRAVRRRLGVRSQHAWVRVGLLLSLLFSLGSFDPHAPWWLAGILPLAGGLRVPTRAWAIATLCAALLVGRGAHVLTRRLERPLALTCCALLAILVVGESWIAPVVLNRPIWIYPRLDLERLIDQPGSDLTARLGRLPPGTPVLELPLGEGQLALAYMFRSVRHWQPLLNGFSGFIPPEYSVLVDRMHDFPDPVSLATLQRMGVEWLVVHPELWRGAAGETLRRRLHETASLRVVGYWRDGLLVRFVPR